MDYGFESSDIGDSGSEQISTDMGEDSSPSDMGMLDSESNGDLTDTEDNEVSEEDDTLEASSEEESEAEEEKDSDEPNEETEEEKEPGEGEGERKPVNSRYANDTYSFEGKAPELHERYPEGVDFDADGHPDFSPYATELVEIDMKGNYTTDYADANAAAGLEETPEGYTWHHHQDGKTMILVPTDLHGAVGHTGGVSTIKNQ